MPCKSPVLVILQTAHGACGGSKEDFLKELKPCLLRSYKWIFLGVNTNNDNWINCVEDKLKCIYQKFCKKAIIVSTLFTTDLEMKLAWVQQCASTIYLTHSTTSANVAFRNAKVLPIPLANGKCVERSNNIYNNDGGDFDFIYDGPIPHPKHI